MSDCKAYLREIEDVAEGAEPYGATRAHAEVCRACGERLSAAESLRGLVRGLGKVEAPADFEFRLRARMAAAQAAKRRGPFGGLRSALRLVPVAAAACFLVVSASLYIWQSSRMTPNGRTRPAAEELASAAADAQERATPATSIKAASDSPGGGVNDRAYSAAPQLSLTAGRRQHAVARRLKVPAQRPAAGEAEPALRTTVASLSSAEVIRGRATPIPLETAAAPLRLVLKDERGAERVVPVRSVSFGAQDLIVREGAGRQKVASDDEGVW